MNKRHSSIDGLIPRRSGEQLGGLHRDINKSSIDKSNNRILENKIINNTEDDKGRILGQPQASRNLERFNANEPLPGIDDINEPVKKLSRRQRRRLEKQAAKKPRSLVRRLIKWLIILIFLVGLLIGGYMTFKFINAGNNIFQGSIFDIFKTQPLEQDINGRSNFLILGTSEDDPGHQGATLTDSIMVVSVDQTNKNVYMFSVPRDLVVEYGEACNAGYSGKINEYFSCINSGTTKEDEQDRLSKTQKFIGDIFGIDIQYGIHVNYTVMRDVIDAIGGSITVTIESRDPRGQMDGNFDWKCGGTYSKRLKNCPPNGHFIDYPNGPVTIDAEHALYLAQARGDTDVNYGFELSNFDREKNQQKILVAIRDKALSNGILTNLNSVTQLINALGENLRTNIQTDEIRTLIQIVSEIKSSDIHSLDLFTSGLMTGDGNPAAGVFDYTDIQAYISKNLSSNLVVQEGAPVVVLNGTDQPGLGQTEADKLTTEGFNVTLVSNAPENTYTKTVIYQIGTDNSATANKLTSLFNVTILKTKPPVTVNGDVRFVIIIGAIAS